jgi:hypothetical protein
MAATAFQPTLPDYLLKYPQIQTAVSRIHGLLKNLPSSADKKLYNDGRFELEARFGTVSQDGRNSFQPGVTKEFMHQCLQFLDTYPDWKLVKDWEETHDYYYELPPHPEDLRGQGILVRTSVAFRKQGDSMAEIVTEHTCKQVRDKQDFRYVANHRMGGMSPPGMDVRVSLNFEEIIPADSVATSIPARVQPKYVRIKNRKSFIYQPAHSTVPIWSLDFTKSWSASTRSQAETKQKQQQTVYEIEVECLDPYTYMNDPRRDQFYLATSLMLKMRDFVGIDSQFHWEPVYRYM